MQNLPSSSRNSLDQASQAELARFEEVLLLLENLFQREEATAKSIIDCLYEVGTVRMIRHRVPFKVFQWPLKLVAGLNKPIFRAFALRWCRRKCPWLITTWLFTQVKFDGEPLPIEEIPRPVIDVAPVRGDLPPAIPPLVERQAAEINALRSRVSWLTVAVVVLATLGCLNLVG